ncbi:wax ester synthase/diacylglycerol acyltransferase 11-like [Cornus florida]|uniref:wax ester synthase/diacylglycerol acyltransferase 11-like n=1 Tax=Cornus florida TaxID=4283 RepID=UPI00289EF77D|nr:wax ester synthase/diacylglycerol acyltransferase 11-like [Cornus florida]
MEFQLPEAVSKPASPISQYFNSSVLSISILAVLELEIPMDDSLTTSLIKDVFLPINPRFSSIMVGDKNGMKKWKRVEVKLEDHVHVPIFPEGMSPELYDEHLNDYLANIAKDQLPQSRPLWEIHIVKYPTSNAAENIIFKLHHALGDGYSLMGALLSCLQRADNPSLPLTFPSCQSNTKLKGKVNTIFRFVPRVLAGIINTSLDFGWSLLKSTWLEDDLTPIRSGDGVEFRPLTVTTIIFSLDHIKEIKDNLKVTINDVITGIIFLGTRLYMQSAASHDLGNSTTHSSSTALVLLNTRSVGGYKSVSDMVKPDAEMPWGNHFAFLHLPIPNLTDDDCSSNPLNFILKAHHLMKRKKNSSAVYLTGRLLETMRKLKGAEATAKYVHSTLKNSSMAISNMIGPVEPMALANHPISGLYFTVIGSPLSLCITMVSYIGKLRVAVSAEKDYIDPLKFNPCINKAFQIIHEAVVHKYSS